MKQTASKNRHGISLMEVLASTFVIGVGLLGVLAVIPFGAYQIGKARDAEHCLNMLQSAEADLQIMGLAKPVNWNNGNNVADNAGTTVYDNSSTNLDTNRLIMVDPFNTANPTWFDGNLRSRMHFIGANLDNPALWRERMRGQDDLDYTRIEDQRPDFSAQNNKVRSSGKYTWFFTFKPTSYNAGDTVDVDIIACYNRVPGIQDTERSVNIDNSDYAQYQNGARLKLTGSAEELDLKNAKIALITWGSNSWCWCKIVNVTDYDGAAKYVIVVKKSGDNLPNNTNNNFLNPKAFIVDGALYHHVANGVTIRD